MGLQDHIIKSEYRSLADNVIQNFYLPLLSDSIIYKRAVGYFSSTSLIEISKGISNLVKNGGRIQIVASPYLSAEDIEAMNNGYKSREQIICDSIERDLLDEELDYYSMKRLNLLANLIAEGILDIKIAFVENEKGIGMYHEKMGIMSDGTNTVAFSGSMNESLTALSLNYESIDVYCNWKSEYEKEKVVAKENAFDKIWNNLDENVKTQYFPRVSELIIDKYKRNPMDLEIDEEQFQYSSNKTKSHINEAQSPYNVDLFPKVPDDINLFDYQNDAISVWVGENYRGIFDMATGTGKTLTALGAIAKISEDLDGRLAVIILCPYQHLVDQWVEDIVKFNISPIIAYSSSPQKDWKMRLSKAIRDQKLRDSKRFFCLICTNATFSSKFVQEKIETISSEILLVVDEAHNVGAKTYAKLLDNKHDYRLALSATLDRYRDDEGTKVLYDFFGKKCIKYDLKRAIVEKKLTKYYYYPVVVTLNEEELIQYENITNEISKHITTDLFGNVKLDKYGEILAIKRSRIVAGAQEKLDALRGAIIPYKEKNNLLVYCGATNIFDETGDNNSCDELEIRQIDAVIKMLGNELNMKVARFTSDEDSEERQDIKERFVKGDRLQALVAIRCLDEGVNIPGITTAFILASTTNPKEYIQRRGRVLRTAPGKEFAEIYDFITLPRTLDTVNSLTLEQAERDLSLVKNEIKRLEEFGSIAINSVDSYSLIWELKDAYHITDSTEGNKDGLLEY